jgi:SAM-dependent methyltransferase
MIERQSYWENVYATKSESSVSWFEEAPILSMALIERATDARGAVIDIGAGASRLSEALLDAGFADVACLDLSTEAMGIARKRLGERGGRVRWIVADAARWSPDRQYDVWHDRAAFHFLTKPADQARYASILHEALVPGGVAVIGTFAPDGPERCSGLPVTRHDSASLSAILGAGFTLLWDGRHAHRTPAGAIQNFQFSIFQRD